MYLELYFSTFQLISWCMDSIKFYHEEEYQKNYWKLVFVLMMRKLMA